MVNKEGNAGPTKEASSYNKTGGGGGGQNQFFAGDTALATILGTTDAGGMRGIGLLLFMIAEISLKKRVVDLAEDYYKTNKKDYQFFVANHRPAIELTAQQAFNTTTNPVYTADYYASLPGGMSVVAPIERKWFEARRRANRYASGVHARLDHQFAVQRTFAIVAGWNMGRRYEELWADAHNERAFNRKIAVANIGIDVGNIASQGLATAVQGVTNAYDNIGDTVASIGNGFAAQSGYNSARAGVRKAYNKEEK